MAVFGDESSQTLAAKNDSFAFQLFVSTFDGDDADEQIFGERPEGWQSCAGLEAVFGNFAFDLVNDLLVERAVSGG